MSVKFIGLITDVCTKYLYYHHISITSPTQTFFLLPACSILEKALKTAENLELESEKLGIHDRLRNIEEKLFRETSDDNQCHSERAKKLWRNEAVQHNASSMQDLLELLEKNLMEMEDGDVGSDMDFEIHGMEEGYDDL